MSDTIRRASLAAVAATLLVGAAPPSTLTIVGYNDMDEMLQALTERYALLHPATRFVLELKSTRSAPAALASGRSDLAPMGAAMTAEDLAAFRGAGGAAPVAIRVAHDSLSPRALSSPTGVLVGRDAPLRAVSLQALRRVVASRSTNPPRWRDLGARGVGADRPVHVVGLAPTTAIGRFLLARFGIAEFSAGYKGLAQSRDVAAAVAADPDALGLANLSHAGGSLRALDLIDDAGHRYRPTARAIVAGHYPFDRYLLVYLRSAAAGRAAKDFVRFMLSSSGQRIIAAGRKGYLPLNGAERSVERAKLG